MQTKLAAATGLDLTTATTIRVVNNDARADETPSISETDHVPTSTLLSNTSGTHRNIPIAITSPFTSCDTDTSSPIHSSVFGPRLSISRGGTPRTFQSHRTPKTSHSFGDRGKLSLDASSPRSRGMTFPHVSSRVIKSGSHKTLDANPHTPENSSTDSLQESGSDRDRDADSVLSFTPSMGGKNLANWFSGLLGRS
jgi:hypothetical protein